MQSLNRVRLFETPWIQAHQASLSSTVSQNLLKFMSILAPFILLSSALSSSFLQKEAVLGLCRTASGQAFPRRRTESPSAQTSDLFEGTWGPQNGLPWWLRGKESACQCKRYFTSVHMFTVGSQQHLTLKV